LRLVFRAATRSCADLSFSYPRTFERKRPRSVDAMAAIAASSFCPVKYVLKNSSFDIPMIR